MPDEVSRGTRSLPKGTSGAPTDEELAALIKPLWLKEKPSGDAQAIRGAISTAVYDSKYPQWVLDYVPDYVWNLIDIAAQRGIARARVEGRSGAISLGPDTLSRIIWLCDKEVIRLRAFGVEHADDPNSEDDVSDADNDATYWASIATMLRNARDVAVVPADEFDRIRQCLINSQENPSAAALRGAEMLRRLPTPR